MDSSNATTANAKTANVNFTAVDAYSITTKPSNANALPATVNFITTNANLAIVLVILLLKGGRARGNVSNFRLTALKTKICYS